MNSPDTLLVLSALRAAAGPDGSFVLTRKFVDGVLEYALRWPGKVMVAVEPALHADSNLDHINVRPSDVAFELRWLNPADREELQFLAGNASVILASLVDKHIGLADLANAIGTPLVFITEYSLQTRRQIIRAETTNALLRWRRERWAIGMEKRYRWAVQHADGIQCNGTPTYEAYRQLNRNPLLFFDTRVRAADVASPETIKARTAELLSGAPLRLA